MNHFEFMQLAASEQYQLIDTHGVQIAQREDGINKYFLYQLHSFYVEGKFNCKSQTPAGIRSFTSTLALEGYLEKIDISGIV